MTCAHSKRHWMVERCQMREAITKHKANQTPFQRLRVEKDATKVKPRELKITYVALKKDMRG